jgi:ribonuclease-3
MTFHQTESAQQETPQEFARRLGLSFGKDISLLQRALTHRSYVNEHTDAVEDNERLEFLGDAVLDFIVGAYLYNHFPEMAEGDLTRMRSALVHTEQLAEFAQEIQLGEVLRLGHGEAQAGGRQKPPILCDAFEAVVGALYLAAGLKAVATFMQPFITAQTEYLQGPAKLQDPKSQLQEWSQARGLSTPIYHTSSISGPDHARIFEVIVSVSGEQIGTGSGKSKQLAEKEAARKALDIIGKQNIS